MVMRAMPASRSNRTERPTSVSPSKSISPFGRSRSMDGSRIPIPAARMMASCGGQHSSSCASWLLRKWGLLFVVFVCFVVGKTPVRAIPNFEHTTLARGTVLPDDNVTCRADLWMDFARVLRDTGHSRADTPAAAGLPGGDRVDWRGRLRGHSSRCAECRRRCWHRLAAGADSHRVLPVRTLCGGTVGPVR